MQALHFHHAVQATPTAPMTAEMPWEAELDPFVIHKRGPNDALLPQFTRGVYDICVRRLKNGKAPGPDQLPNELLKHFPVQMHDLLFSFLRMCWMQGMTLATWKNNITLLFYKKGDLANPANYRPIALLNPVYKLWTSIIALVLSSHCEQFGILIDPQEGFRKHKNCQRQLQYLKLLLEDAKLQKCDLHVTLLDIKSAFNSVDHHCLLKVLQALGLPPDVLAIIQDLHTAAATSIRTNFGTTDPVPLR